MSGLFSSTPNYSGRQGDNDQNIKQFVQSPGYGTATWIYKKLLNYNVSLITPSDQTKSVLIPKDLIVLGSINNPSDNILKENIETIDSTDFLKLNPVKFQFKNDSKRKNHFGLIAQELETVYPELVSNNSIGFKTVNYIELIPILISQIKTMQNDIDILKSELNEIKMVKNEN
jgi:hypothetical protein